MFNNPLSFTDPSGYVAWGLYADYGGYRGSSADAGYGEIRNPRPGTLELVDNRCAADACLEGVDAWLYLLQSSRNSLFPNTMYMGNHGVEGTWWDASKGFLKGTYNFLLSASPGTAPFAEYLEAEITPKQASGAALF